MAMPTQRVNVRKKTQINYRNCIFGLNFEELREFALPRNHKYQTTQSNEKKVIDSDASKHTAQSNEKNVISSDASKFLEVSDDSSVEIIEYASCFSPYKSQLSREFSEEMEKWEKKMKRKRALANVITISDDDEAPEDEVESSEEVSVFPNGIEFIISLISPMKIDFYTFCRLSSNLPLQFALQFMGSEWLVDHTEWAGEEGSSNAQLDLELTLRPPGPTAKEIERELSSFLSSFGNRRVASSVLKKTMMKLQLDVASRAKLLKIQGLMRDLKSRPVHAYREKYALL
ncbi:hypothetical protein LXL04_023566 [Taraxacum kok-saghyz]